MIKYIITTLYILSFFLISTTHAVDKLPFGAACDDAVTSNGQCMSGDCEDSTKANKNNNDNYCDCDEDRDCNIYGKETGETWDCVDGNNASHDLDYCLSSKGRIEFPIARTDSSPTDAIFDPEVLISEMREQAEKPQTKINIPGINFSEPEVITEGDTTFLVIPYLSEYIAQMYKYSVMLAGVGAVLIIIVGGFQFTISGGAADKKEAAKKRIGGAIIGLLIAAGSYTVLYTINPNLVELKNLKVEYVERETVSEYMLDHGHFPGSADCSPQNCDDYDAIFKAYAPCANVDWRMLKSIAKVETGCNPGCIAGNFIGMGMTQPKYCNGPFKKAGYEKLNYVCTKQKLLDPNVGVAAIALNQKDAIALAKKYCSNASISEIGASLYAYHNTPAAARLMIIKGCTDREAFVSYYLNMSQKQKEKALNTTAYRKKFGHLLQKGQDGKFTNESMAAYLRKIGELKVNFSFSKAGPAFEKYGGNINNPVYGVCKLDTSNPF